MQKVNPRIYLETTIFNRYFEDERDYSRETKLLFEEIQSGKITAYTSIIVLEELDKAPEPKRTSMLSLVSEYKITILQNDERVDGLADIYIAAKIIQHQYKLDGVHIAMASIYNLDCIISLNFRHINNIKTKTKIEAINDLKNYSTPIICTPTEVVE
jgi:predicted nucleic acid-binding protein